MKSTTSWYHKPQ